MSGTIPEFTTTRIEDGFSPEDAETKELYNEVGAFAKQGQPLVIFGPTGAGKEFLARHYYKIFVNTELYEQYKQSWPSKYEEIRKQYSSHYSEKCLRIFLNSLRAGVFQSINSATIYPNLAESIIFGHEADAFNNAKTSPGLVETIKYGVLFMDEVGELPESLQAKFLRAIDSEIREGRRISGKMDYSLRDLIIIAATNQPREMLRNDFYYKIGFDVEIKGIDERPKDVRRSIPYFIRKAIGKRKDNEAVIKMFGITELQDVSKLAEAEQVRNFAQEQSELVIREILMRKWPGNFRALRITLEASILRIESPKSIGSFSREFRNNLHHYIPRYSANAAKTSIPVQGSVQDPVYPSPYPDIDRRILEKMNAENIWPETGDFEKNVLAVFLSSTHKVGFKRKDIENHYKKYGAIKHHSESHVRGKISQLLTSKILKRKGKSKGIRYQLSEYFLDSIVSRPAEIFSLPEVNETWIPRDREVDTLSKILLTAERIYIQAPPRYGKSAFITMFCDAKKDRYNFYYYLLGEAGIKKLFEDILNLLQSKEIISEPGNLLDDAVKNIQPYLGKLFQPKEGAKPLLILDNAHFISDPHDTGTIVELAKEWKNVIVILVGDKMDNALLEDFYEFSLGPWGKQT